MKEKTAELVIKIVVEVANWLTDKMKNRRKEKDNDGKGTAKKRSES